MVEEDRRLGDTRKKTQIEEVQPQTIMVIDDMKENLHFLHQVLSKEGYRVKLFPKGDLALNSARREPPDLILLDINMPGLDGYRVCEILKDTEELKDIPVIFFSGLKDVDSVIQAFEKGGVDYISKPFRIKEVQVRVETHLHLRRLQREQEEYNHRLEELVHEKVQEISNSQKATILALAKLTESRDDETGNHVERVSSFSSLLAKRLLERNGMEELMDSFLNNIHYAAALHDIGKVGIPDAILCKKGALKDKEFALIKTHTTIGAKTLEEIHTHYPNNSMIEMGVHIAKYHHERWDGGGYEGGLKGDKIPFSARIVALADVYDALRSRRPYKEPFSHKRALEILYEEEGGHFDPFVLQAFKEVEQDFKRVHDSYSNGK